MARTASRSTNMQKVYGALGTAWSAAYAAQQQSDRNSPEYDALSTLLSTIEESQTALSAAATHINAFVMRRDA